MNMNTDIRPSKYALDLVGLQPDKVKPVLRTSYIACKKCVLVSVCSKSLSFMDMMCRGNHRQDFWDVFWEKIDG